MTGTELVKRSQSAENLRVFQVDADDFLVESSDKKICYKVSFGSEKQVCTCPDFVNHTRADEHFRCKHIISVGSSVANHEAEKVSLSEKAKPKLDERFLIEIDGREFVKYPGLLDLGHQKGIVKIEVDPLQYPKKTTSIWRSARHSLFLPRGRALLTSAMPTLRTAAPRYGNTCSEWQAPEPLHGH